MREIKFRVWQTDHEEMEYFDLFNAEQYAADGPIMQYTGLKDKNGKEIYEGDIVKRIEKTCEENAKYMFETYEPYKIKKFKNQFYLDDKPLIEIEFRHIVSLKNLRLWLQDECFGYDGEDLVSPNNSEIIGNIYENPELLEEKGKKCK